MLRDDALGGVILAFVVGAITCALALFYLPDVITRFVKSVSPETRIEGQVTAPANTVLSKVVWIVRDFRELESGIAGDLMAERSAIEEQIRDRQDYLSHIHQPQDVEQAQSDLSEANAAITRLDDKYYKQLANLPEANRIERIPLDENGRFTWVEEMPFPEGVSEQHHGLFARAIRADGRESWALCEIHLTKDQTSYFNIVPKDFISMKAILHPDLSPEERER